MAKIYAKPTKGVLDGTAPMVPGDAALMSGKIHAVIGMIDMAEDDVASGDVIVWGELPKGAVPVLAFLDTTATLGTATIDLGTDATAAKFKAAATLTNADTPTFGMKAAALGVALTAKALLQSVVATADLPAAGTLCAVLLYTTPHSG